MADTFSIAFLSNYPQLNSDWAQQFQVIAARTGKQDVIEPSDYQIEDSQLLTSFTGNSDSKINGFADLRKTLVQQLFKKWYVQDFNLKIWLSDAQLDQLLQILIRHADSFSDISIAMRDARGALSRMIANGMLGRNLDRDSLPHRFACWLNIYEVGQIANTVVGQKHFALLPEFPVNDFVATTLKRIEDENLKIKLVPKTQLWPALAKYDSQSQTIQLPPDFHTQSDSMYEFMCVTHEAWHSFQSRANKSKADLEYEAFLFSSMATLAKFGGEESHESIPHLRNTSVNNVQMSPAIKDAYQVLQDQSPQLYDFLRSKVRSYLISCQAGVDSNFISHEEKKRLMKLHEQSLDFENFVLRMLKLEGISFPIPEKEPSSDDNGDVLADAYFQIYFGTQDTLPNPKGAKELLITFFAPAETLQTSISSETNSQRTTFTDIMLE